MCMRFFSGGATKPAMEEMTCDFQGLEKLAHGNRKGPILMNGIDILL